MKFFCERSALEEAINIVNKAISPNNTLPVLNNILIKAEGGKIEFSSTNLEIAITCNISAEVKEEGAITVPAKLITGYLAFLNEDAVEIELVEGNSLSIKTNTSSTKIKCIEAEEFPLIPEVNDGQSFTVPLKDFYSSIAQTVFAASLNTARPVLSGVLMSYGNDGLRMAATDSYRLAERTLGIQTNEAEVLCVVPSRTMSEFSKILSKSTSDNVSVTVAKNQALFKIGDVKLISRLIEGQYPDYQKIIPQESKSIVIVNKDKLVMDLKRVSLFAKENNNSVKLTVSDNKLIISSEETKIGEEVTSLEVKLEGEDNQISLNAQYLLDALNVIDGGNVRFMVNDNMSPAVLRPESGDDYVCIIMPLKV